MNLKNLIAIAVLVLGIVSIMMYKLITLAALEVLIESYFSVQQIETSLLAEKLQTADSTGFLIFDTRRRDEYERSHLRTAIRVEPEMAAEAFIENNRKQIPGKQLIFYCSVGGRSSIFAERVKDKALALQAKSILNLRGGIFRWYNDGYPVFNAFGETDDIHPYNVIWEKLVKQRQ